MGVMSGVRVLEVAEHTFVPAAAGVLADWGAEVIKVEHVERGDAMRGIRSTGIMDLGQGPHVLFEHSNRGKRSIGLDLSQPDGIDILYRLAAMCDVFVTNKLAAVRAKLAMDVDDIRRHQPSIIYACGSAYGARGPDADKGGYDVSGFWYRGGSAIGARPAGTDRPPGQPGPAYGDTLGAAVFAGGIAAALFHRERTGEASVVDASLLGLGVWAMGSAVGLSAQSGSAWQQPADDRSGPRNPLVGNYRTADGEWLHLSVLQAFRYWHELCGLLELGYLATDERFDTADKLTRNGAAAAHILAERIGSQPIGHWAGRLAAFTGQWAVVQSSHDILADEQVRANNFLVDSRTADGEPIVLASVPVQFDGRHSPPRPAPAFNADGDDILQRDLGLDYDSILQLKVKGVLA
jgi:crotonobetainyl-CoA:carnitine CoA-transferase CaiB-like acyl-CoA transferase